MAREHDKETDAQAPHIYRKAIQGGLIGHFGGHIFHLATTGLGADQGGTTIRGKRHTQAHAQVNDTAGRQVSREDEILQRNIPFVYTLRRMHKSVIVLHTIAKRERVRH